MLRTLVPVAVSALVVASLPSPSPMGDSTRRSYPWRVELNIPAFRIDVLRDSTRIRSFGVAVGSLEFPTPRGAFAITEVTWNPWWYPPSSEWAREDTVTPPGPRNPMGRVKLQLGAAYYIHGTPLESTIGSAASHGCIRMRNADAIALARLLQEGAGITMTDEEIERLLATRTTRTVPLFDSVPVALVYRTAEVYADTLTLHPDIYRLRVDRFAEATAALLAAGMDSASVEGLALDSLVGAARTASVAVPLPAIRRAPSVSPIAPWRSRRDDRAAAARSPNRATASGCVSR